MVFPAEHVFEQYQYVKTRLPIDILAGIFHGSGRSRREEALILPRGTVSKGQSLLTSTPTPSGRQNRALTILEMLVSTALLSVIVLGLTAMLIQTQNAFKSGTKQTSSTDAGRAVIDMIASDLSQMTDPHFTNVYNPWVSAPPPPSSYFLPTNLAWSAVAAYDLKQYQNGVVFRTNQLEDLYVLLQTNNIWFGIGYSVSNWFTNGAGGPIAGVGTLYRYTANMTGPLTNNNPLYQNYVNALGNNFNNFHRIADGIVHLKIYPYDASGNPDPMFYGYGPYSYPTVITNYGGVTYQTNYLPHSVDIEVGILEPEALEHARALYQSGANIAASNYLANAVGQVEIFRQHIIIPGAP